MGFCVRFLGTVWCGILCRFFVRFCVGFLHKVFSTIGVKVKCHTNSKLSGRFTLDKKAYILRLLLNQIDILYFV